MHRMLYLQQFRVLELPFPIAGDQVFHQRSFFDAAESVDMIPQAFFHLLLLIHTLCFIDDQSPCNSFSSRMKYLSIFSFSLVLARWSFTFTVFGSNPMILPISSRDCSPL